MHLILNQIYLMFLKWFWCKKKKKNLWLGVLVFCEWRHKWSSFGPFWLMLPGLGPNC